MNICHLHQKSSSDYVQDETFEDDFEDNESEDRLAIRNSIFKVLNGTEDTLDQIVDEKIKTMNKKKRIVSKNGDANISLKSISKKRRLFLSDWYTTLLDSSLPVVISAFTASFFGSWLLFAILYWGISYVHSDLSLENLNNSDWRPCFAEIKDFTSSFLFSLETQHTIGYGTRQVTTQCPHAIVLVSLQVEKERFHEHG